MNQSSIVKSVFVSVFIFVTSCIYAQDCDPFTVSADIVEGKLKQRLLLGEDDVFNPLYIKTGIGPDGDIDTRTYAPLISSSNLWVGGLDPSGNIKLAAGLYEQQDWRPGPLNIIGDTDVNTCNEWNRIWTVTKEEILAARAVFNDGGDCNTISQRVLTWPAKGNPYAPVSHVEFAGGNFWDENGDGLYDPCGGDVPVITIGGCHVNKFSELPAEISYYTMNDNGAAHAVSYATPIQLTVHVHSFRFNSQETEGIIFHQYKIHNQASEDIRELKVGAWLDFDLGCWSNDRIGSVPDQNMVYAYNANNDEDCGENGLSNPSTIVGYSFLSGPVTPLVIIEGSDGQDSLVFPQIGSGNFDTLVNVGVENVVIPNDCFMINFPSYCYPQVASDFYNLMNGKYFDGSSIIGPDGLTTSTMFDGNPANPNEWSACSDGADQVSTAIMSYRSLLMQPQARNVFYSATFYSEDTETGCPDVASIKYKQRRAKRIYRNCFHNYNGPPAPNLRVRYIEDGVEIDVCDIPTTYVESVPFAYNPDHQDLSYKFEGVKIYQVASGNFDMTELDNPSMSVLVYQGDIANGISEIKNHKFVFEGAEQRWVEEVKVNGANEGIEEKISLTYDFIRDQSIDTNDELYYVALSYGYNDYEDFNPTNTFNGEIYETGQQYRYIETTYGLKTTKSVVHIAATGSPLEARLYSYIYNENTISIFDVEENISLDLYSIDGRLTQQWKVKKGNDFSSNILSEDLASGLYVLLVTVDNSGLNDTHKLVVQ